jgi:RNA polymerase sigma-70 factor, ECF subfamily
MSEGGSKSISTPASKSRSRSEPKSAGQRASKLEQEDANGPSGSNLKSKIKNASGDSVADRLADHIEAIAHKQDRSAFAEIFSYYAPRVKGYLIRLGMGAQQAEELSQDVMLTVWRKAPLYDRTVAAPSTWIFTIARNRRIDVMRKHRFTEFELTDPALVGEDPERPDDYVEARSRDNRVRKAIENLPADQADIIKQAFFNDWSHSEVAEKTGLPLGTVKSRLRLAFGRLRQALEEG